MRPKVVIKIDEKGRAICAQFDTTFHCPEYPAMHGKRVKHYVHRTEIGGYEEIQHFLVPESVMPNEKDRCNFVTKRVFFGKYRAAQIIVCHKTETWMIIAEVIRQMERLLPSQK